MSAAFKPVMTLDAFLDWERRQAERYEFDGFNLVAINGGTWAHWTIQSNLMGLLFNGLRGHRCRALGAGMKVRTGTGVRYPDALVICNPVTPNTEMVTDPVIVFEILSPSTSTTDYTDKNQEYRDTPSIQRYVILEQSKPAAMVFTRDGTDWVGHLQIGDTVLDLPEIGLTLPLISLYEGALDPPQPEP